MHACMHDIEGDSHAHMHDDYMYMQYTPSIMSLLNIIVKRYPLTVVSKQLSILRFRTNSDAF
jgi:hypothetical protein